MHSAAITVLADAGQRGRDAEIALRHLLAELASPTERSRAVLADLGLEAADVDCSIHRNVVIFRRLADAGLDAAGAEAMFGSAAGVAMILVENVERLEQLDS